MEKLIYSYIMTKKVPPKHVNELLAFLEWFYNQGEISKSRYMQLIQQLEDCGATKVNV